MPDFTTNTQDESYSLVVVNVNTVMFDFKHTDRYSLYILKHRSPDRIQVSPKLALS